MDAHLHFHQLVARLLSEGSAERERALAEVDPSSFGTLEFQAVREALRHARSQGRLSDGDYQEVLIQTERWYRAGDGSNTSDLPPVQFDPEDPTVEIVASTLQKVEADSGAASEARVREAAAVPSSRPQFIPGATIRDRYVLEEQIGIGGSAIVFRARDLRRDPTDRDAHVALKVSHEHLRDREDITERLKRELHQSQALAHPGIVRVFDIDCEQGIWFLTMELLDGEPLSAMLSRFKAKRIPQREALAIISGCAEALAFAHDRGVLHGDFKPGNVFVTRSKQVRVLDFGVVTHATPAPHSSAVSRGSHVAAATPCYASPAVLLGEPPDERDDVFSLACVTYEVLTGRHPFGRRSTVDARDRGLRAPRVAWLSRSQFAALERGLQWSNRKRPATVRKFLTELGVLPQRQRVGLIRGLAAVALAVVIIATILFGVERDAAQRSDQPASAPRPAPIEQRAVLEVTPTETSTQPAHDSPAAVAERRLSPSLAPAVAVSATRMTETAQTSQRGGRISLEQSSIVVDERAVAAVVIVKRLEDLSEPARIQWRAIPGSAKPGTDYSVDGLKTIDIPEGHDVRVIYIPILNDTLKEGNESFEVELLPVAGRGRLGPIARATITIFDED